MTPETEYLEASGKVIEVTCPEISTQGTVTTLFLYLGSFEKAKQNLKSIYDQRFNKGLTQCYYNMKTSF
mgnify:CR=1 FL=1